MLMKKYAEFHKCALQVNPFSYISYRGEQHGITEEQYNEELLKQCLENNVRVVGLADHGDTQSSEGLRELLSKNGIVVFPGFEIASAEKIHMVCLFDESASSRTLERYLGKLDLIDVEDGVAPSKLSCMEIARIVVDELNGFWYAAHITSDNGVLSIGKMQHIWKSEYLKVAQIPSTRANVDPKYINIINNKEPQYKRERMLAYINAKDVSKPSDIALPEASSLAKMSEVNFQCFKQAFNDPESRIKLVTELDENHHSVIEKIQIFGGYLDGLDMYLSPHLNSFIGGRGTGKSTLIELIRYAIELEPKSKGSRKSLDSLINSNLGIDKGRIEITVSSNKQHGKQYKIIKRYGDPVVITDLDGEVSNLTIEDILPNTEIYGQNEMIEITEDDNAKVQILDRFLPNQENSLIKRNEILKKLEQNRVNIVNELTEMDDLEQQVQKLPGLLEKKKAFAELGLTEKLSDLEKISKEEGFFSMLTKDLNKDINNLDEIDLPIQVENLNEWLHKDLLLSAEKIVNKLNLEINRLNIRYKEIIEQAIKDIEDVKSEWKLNKDNVDKEIDKLIKDLPEIHGTTGNGIAEEYKKVLNDITRISPMEKELTKKQSSLDESYSERKSLLELLRSNKDECEQELRKVIKKINKRSLNGKVKINLQPRNNRENLKKFFVVFPGLAEKSLEWIDQVEDLSIPALSKDIDNGLENLYEKYSVYGLTKSKAEIIVGMTDEQWLQLDEVELLDVIDIQLNIGVEKENYKSLEQLSKGQQCTAVLNILLLDNKDPLIIDQPEDNLDNAFIANNIVNELRNNKLKRQFIFATHNANIPVFGDAELIGVLNEEDGQGKLNDDCLGSIDTEGVRKAVIQTLEGGNNAFRMRKAKYNL